MGDEAKYTNSLGMVFADIPAGEFGMGSPEGVGWPDERPRLVTRVDRPFRLAVTPVTLGQWRALMGESGPGAGAGENCPVEAVSWEDAREFIRRLNVREGHDRYRLPAEAEWEYACRAGSNTAYCFGDDPADLEQFAWYEGNSGGRAQPVGRKRPNAWGLFDMHGNVDEWCEDWFHESAYRDAALRDAATGSSGGPGRKAGLARVLRGGGWSSSAAFCRSALRWFAAPETRFEAIGFRVVLAASLLSAHINSVDMEFATVPAGSFVMGSQGRRGGADETPQHVVRITRPFLLGRHPVTQRQWRRVMGDNPSRFKGEDLPVDSVSWEDAQAFISRLNALEGHNRCRLPFEAEWEYACRAGTDTAYSFGDDPARARLHAWFKANAGERTHPVGRLAANPWGLYDMHGNVLEWCADWFDKRYYAESPTADPRGPDRGKSRVLRRVGDGRPRFRLQANPPSLLSRYQP